MAIREVYISGKKLVIQELEDLCDSVTGCALTGSWVWDSALVLSEWMATQSDFHFDFRGKTVLELGAGAGIPGLTAALLGASRVILTDVEPLLPGLRRNVEANGLGDVVDVSRLMWGSDELPSQLSELGRVDLVVVSDVFFDTSEIAALAKTLRMICSDGTRVWAACKLRPWTSDILGELVREGFEITELPSQLCEFSSLVTNGFSDVFAVFQLTPSSKENEYLELVD